MEIHDSSISPSKRQSVAWWTELALLRGAGPGELMLTGRGAARAVTTHSGVKVTTDPSSYSHHHPVQTETRDARESQSFVRVNFEI